MLASQKARVRNSWRHANVTPMADHAIAAMIQEWLISRRRRTRATAPQESELAA